MTDASAVDLLWLPLGAGGHSVRVNGLVFEAVAAAVARRERRDLYHSALEVTVPAGRYVVEQAPAWSSSRPQTGVGACGTSSSTRRATAASRLSRRGLSTASRTSGIVPPRQRLTS